jgi:GNAT superfamily N-acetyltransferase
MPARDGRVALRPLQPDEIDLVRQMDRTELIERIYYYENGALALRPERYDMRDWPPGELDGIIASLRACHEGGGWLAGLFDGQRLVGVVALGHRFFGAEADQLQLVFLHVSHGYRDRGHGARLFGTACDVARRRGARALYISATPSEHTVRFYLARGCRLHPQPDAELFAQEPEDIHLLLDL